MHLLTSYQLGTPFKLSLTVRCLSPFAGMSIDRGNHQHLPGIAIGRGAGSSGGGDDDSRGGGNGGGSGSASFSGRGSGRGNGSASGPGSGERSKYDRANSPISLNVKNFSEKRRLELSAIDTMSVANSVRPYLSVALAIDQ